MNKVLYVALACVSLSCSVELGAMQSAQIEWRFKEFGPRISKRWIYPIHGGSAILLNNVTSREKYYLFETETFMTKETAQYWIKYIGNLFWLERLSESIEVKAREGEVKGFYYFWLWVKDGNLKRAQEYFDLPVPKEQEES